MKFLIDAQLPPALAQWLRKAGYDAKHVQDLDLHRADDTAIRAHVARCGFVLITKDRDFAPVNTDDCRGIQVVWMRTGNMSTRALIDRIEKVWPRVARHLNDGVRLVEVR